MKSYVDAAFVDPSHLTYREMGPWESTTPLHLRHALRLEIPRAELLSVFGQTYVEAVAELRSDIVKSGKGPDDAERAALVSPTLEDFLMLAPQHFFDLLQGLLWQDLLPALFGKNPQSQWHWVIDALESASFTKDLCILEGVAYAMQPQAARN